jgi:hypothetical protein
MSNSFYNSLNSSQRLIASSQELKKDTIFLPARVKDIILDNTHPEWEKYGGPSSLGGVKYQLLSTLEDIEDTSTLPIAFPLYSFIKQVPVKGEIVLIMKGPSENLQDSSVNSKKYFIGPINLWNHPNHNASPEEALTNIPLGEYFEEAGDVNPMQIYEGDILLEGRQGQSLRFTTAYEGKTPWKGEEDGKPLIILSNGQENIGNGYDPVLEDLDKDFSSILLTSNQVINFTPSNTNRKSYISPPIEGGKYNKNQVLINSGRVFINANEDHILLAGSKSVGLSGEESHIDATSKIVIESPRVELGKDATQGILLGEDTIELLRQLLRELQSVGTKLSLATSTPPGSIIPQLVDAGKSLITATQTLETQLKPLLSTKSFVK